MRVRKLLKMIVTVDETWAQKFEPGMWRHNPCSGNIQPLPKRMSLMTEVKVVVIMAYDMNGVITVAIVPAGTTDSSLLQKFFEGCFTPKDRCACTWSCERAWWHKVDTDWSYEELWVGSDSSPSVLYWHESVGLRSVSKVEGTTMGNVEIAEVIWAVCCINSRGFLRAVRGLPSIERQGGNHIEGL
jgi:hypothetical protein